MPELCQKQGLTIDPSELRTELPDLPSSCLWASDFPFSFPSLSKPTDTDQADGLETGDPDPTTASSFYYLAEISLRRLLNRIRNSLGSLNPRMSTPDIQKFSQALVKHEHQLQRWVECLPVALQFAMPLRLEPPSEEPELVQLLRERYTQAYELLRRPYLYLCLHAHLDPELLEISTQRANDCLQLAVYRLRTERPFYRHPGSWGSCRIRFNHALCLVAAAKAKSTCW